MIVGRIPVPRKGLDWFLPTLTISAHPGKKLFWKAVLTIWKLGHNLDLGKHCFDIVWAVSFRIWAGCLMTAYWLFLFGGVSLWSVHSKGQGRGRQFLKSASQKQVEEELLTHQPDCRPESRAIYQPWSCMPRRRWVNALSRPRCLEPNQPGHRPLLLHFLGWLARLFCPHASPAPAAPPQPSGLCCTEGSGEKKSQM